MWHIHAVANILRKTLQTIYLQNGKHTRSCHLQRKIVVRTSSAAASSLPHPANMLTGLFRKDMPEKTWFPNHFVVCLPGSGMSQKKRIFMSKNEDLSDIHLFVCCP
ncbi:hypothetical protein PoB_000234700 [Plakobranchus ocellatus]|uniref:Uncharacterized protein n=1 Tax=Plakobranchus ocellatus TaxID=259542 RepID=A0AAV3XZC8_9GAST|nr:hypothetical protein PoB_000234700 [Plakobranchus ocellatus]